MLSLAELNKQFLNYSHQPFNAQNGLAVLLCNANEHFYLRSKHNSTQVPSTRIRIILKPQLFLFTYSFLSHAFGQYGNESGY